MIDFPVLTSLIVIPAVGAMVLAMVPAARTEVHRLVALISTVITGALSVWAVSYTHLTLPTILLV